MSDPANFAPCIEAVARRLLGEPNPERSTRAELRFGSNGSLSVKIDGPARGTWFSHEDQIGGGVLDLVARQTGLANGQAVEWLREQGFIDPAPVTPTPRRIVATYPYQDEAGALLFEVLRFEPKDFRQRRPDGRGGWSWSVKGVRHVPFRLPELVAAVGAGRTVFIPEGEKDVIALERLGLAATCNAGGAGKFPRELVEHFAGANVVLLPDADQAGRDHGELVARTLAPVAARVRVLALPGLANKGDVSDWLAAGGTREKLLEVVETTPTWSPPEPSPGPDPVSADAGPLGDEPPPPGDDAEPPQQLPPLAGFDVCRWAGREPPDLMFAIAGLMPVGMTTLFVAQGGSGKTLLGQTALTCVAAGLPFLGRDVLPGLAIGLLLEDPDEVLHLRQARINQALGVDYDELAGRLFILPAPEAGLVLWRSGRPTPALAAIEAQLAAVAELRVVVIDNVALVFAGDENNRVEVSQFMAALNGMARRLGVALVLITHASKSTDGTALRVASGSTAFVNSARSVIELKPADGDNPPRLKVVKANHAETGQEIELEWREGVLVQAGAAAGGFVASIDKRNREREADETFLKCLTEIIGQGRHVNEASNSGTYAPKVFARLPFAAGTSKRALEDAMHRLFSAGKIEIGPSGKRSNGAIRSGIVHRQGT